MSERQRLIPFIGSSQTSQSKIVLCFSILFALLNLALLAHVEGTVAVAALPSCCLPKKITGLSTSARHAKLESQFLEGVASLATGLSYH